MKLQLPASLGKYRDLVLAIALFLVIDLGVLVFNYQSSRLLEVDTGRINLASDMRVLSQQLAKAVLTLKQESLSEQPTQTSVAQISEAYNAYSRATTLLQQDLNKPEQEMFDDHARIEQAQALLRELSHTWEPLAETIRPLLSQMSTPSAEDIDIAVNKVVARNTRLMQQAEDLTSHLENMSVYRASQMRMIQLVAILLALLNFAFIVFKFLRSLATSDRATAIAREETDRILNTVREGLFLLGQNGKVGSQQSKSTPALLGRKLSAGENFFAFLRQSLSAEAALAAENYMTVLFNERVKSSLLKQLNPLREVEFAAQDGDHHGRSRFLDFEFQQVLQGGRVENLLVSVSDITENVLLARELAGTKARVKSEVDAVLAVIEQDPAEVSQFLKSADQQLLAMNVSLQNAAPFNITYQQLVAKIARVVHSIKGESGALGLLPVETAAHEFESVLAPLRKQAQISGEDLIPVAVAMNALREDLEKVRRIVTRLMSFGTRESEKSANSATSAINETPLQEVLQHIEQLTLRVASDLNKQVRFEAQLPEAELPRSLVGALREALPQLIRNAVAHGIESAQERLHAGKPAEGVIRCTIEAGEQGQLIIAVEDDGRGIEPHALRQQVIAKGVKTAQEVATMSDEDVVALIFTPGFSSLDESSTHAGRGEGLSVVKHLAERLGARLQISSRPQQYTRFAFLFKDNRWLFA